MNQKIITAKDGYREFEEYLKNNSSAKTMLVHDDSLFFLTDILAQIEKAEKEGIVIVRFSDFEPNPKYDSVVKGVEIFNAEKCDSIVAIGGGSALDVAKCIKLFSNMDSDVNYLKHTIVPNNIPFFAVPTTAGTGSEATRYAVIYYHNEKQSVTHESCIPDTVMLDSSTLKTLPLYQKKATMCDALCHAVESYWSVNSNDESKEYSKKAIQLILKYYRGYLSGDVKTYEFMLKASNYAGKAINITQTTAGHAMCYKITSLFGIAHGHASMLCNVVLLPWIIENTDKCLDKRGEEYLKKTLNYLADIMSCNSLEEASDLLKSIFDYLNLEKPMASESDFEILKKSVNPDRLKNHPVFMDEQTIDMLYHKILSY